jgi:ABC-2 type transport system permease protein
MMSSLIALELRLLLADRRVRWIAGALLVIATVAFGIALREARHTSAEAHRISQLERQRWLEQDPKNPHSAAHYGIWVFKPASPLATLDPGIEPYVGRMIRIEAHRYNDALYRSVQDRSPLSRAGSTTVADVLQLIFPLAAIMLSFSAFAADRERGTLRLALGNGIAPGRLLSARFGALAIATALIVGTPALLLGSVSIASLDSTGWHAWPRLFLWTATQIAYATFFLLIGMLASLVAKTSRAALTASLLAWVVLCIVMPRLATTAIQSVAPTPSYAATRARIEEQIKLYNRADLHQERQQAILSRHGVASAAELRIDLRGAMMHDREQHDYAVFDRELGAFYARLTQQDHLQGLAGLASPMIAVQTASAGLVGSDFRRHADFLRAAEKYRRALSDTMNLDLVNHPTQGGQAYFAGRDVWEKVPPFVYEPAPLAQSLREIVTPLGLLVVWLCVAGGATALTARRIQP